MKKVCVIGAWGHVEQALKTLRERQDFAVVGIAPGCDLEKIPSRFTSVIPFYEDYRVMLDREKPELAIVSPIFGLTAEVIIECTSRNVSVFSEKPVATTLSELKKVERAVKESGIRFCAMHYLRYAPAFYYGAEMVQSGAVGKVMMVTAQKSYKYGSRPEWYGNRALYGGTIPWVGIHAIDWIYHFTGKRFLSVFSKTIGQNPEMAAICHFQLEDGVIASLNLDYYRPEAASTHDDDRIRVVGSEGVLEILGGQISLINGAGVQIRKPTDAPDLLAEFLDGKKIITSQEIFYLTKVAILARDSADMQKNIQIER